MALGKRSAALRPLFALALCAKARMGAERPTGNKCADAPSLVMVRHRWGRGASGGRPSSFFLLFMKCEATTLIARSATLRGDGACAARVRRRTRRGRRPYWGCEAPQPIRPRERNEKSERFPPFVVTALTTAQRYFWRGLYALRRAAWRRHGACLDPAS